MSVLALVTNREEVELVVQWAREFAIARHTTLSVLCCAYAPAVQYALLSDEGTVAATDELVAETQRVLSTPVGEDQPMAAQLAVDNVPIRRAMHPDATTEALQRIRS